MKAESETTVSGDGDTLTPDTNDLNNHQHDANNNNSNHNKNDEVDDDFTNIKSSLAAVTTNKAMANGKNVKPLFLTIDHKLAVRRRNIGNILSAYEEDTPAPRTNDGSPFLRHLTDLVETKNDDQNVPGNHGDDHVVEREKNYDDEQQENGGGGILSNGDLSKTSSMNGYVKNHTTTTTNSIMASNLVKKIYQDAVDNGQQIDQTMAHLIRRILIGIFMAIFITVVQLYTWVTLPLYFIMQKPWIRKSKSDRCKIRRFANDAQEPDDPSLSPIYERDQNIAYQHPIFRYETVADIFDALPSIHGSDRIALGYRQILSEEDSLDAQGNARRVDGRQLKRYRLSDFKWITYGQMDEVTKNIAQGLMARGIGKDDRIIIISETRIEWMLCFQAILRTGAKIVTVFSNLGVDGVAHAIKETEIKNVIASVECLNLLKSALDRGEHQVNLVIYIDGFKPPQQILGDGIELCSLSQIEQAGTQKIKDGQIQPYHKANLNDLMIIMYTSGTTGAPKAAQITQRQFYAAIEALYALVESVMHEAPYHAYVSYLPLAHVLELTVESFFILGGVKVGFSSPFTLTDSAPGLVPGQKSDMKLLKPTIMTSVPLVLDRILKEVNEKLRARTPVSQPIFKFLMEYKSLWTRRGYQCNIVRRLLCQKVREQLGGEIKYMIVGGAPLNSNTQATVKSALDVTLIQGYGATETTGAALCMDLDDLEYGCVGAPLGKVYLRLKDWSEGGYSVRDRPHPRGEILIGGNLIADGYFRRPELNHVFHTDSNGIRWFHTGDIGELYPTGSVKIIDRCKDLIKLQNGEYISLGKVEAALKSCQLVDNVCVYGGTFSSDIVALISPNRKALEQLALSMNKEHLSLEQLCEDYQVQQAFYTEVVKSAKQANLGKKEIPQRIKLVPEEWSPDNGVLTAALKLKRRTIETMYKKELYELYNSKKINVITTNGYDQNNNSTKSRPILTTTNNSHHVP